MVDVNVFSGAALRRVTDVERIKPVERDSDKDKDGKSAFEQILEREKRRQGKKAAEDKKTPDELPVAYGFISFYNGRGVNSYFCMLNSSTDAKV